MVPGGWHDKRFDTEEQELSTILSGNSDRAEDIEGAC
jgi:hypothetical protein